MVTMPGTIESYSPEGEEQTRAITAREPAPYKPDMGLQVKPGGNPYEAFTKDTDPAESVTPADTSWKERFVQHFNNAQRYGTPGVNELTDIRDAQQGYVGGVQVGKDAAQATAKLRIDRRAENMAAYENMPSAQGPLDYAAAIGGEIAGTMADPASLLGAPVKIGTAGWRMAYPFISRMLESSVSNAAMNAAVNATVQAEEYGAGQRNEVDWLGLGMDAAAGAAFGLPFGAAEGSAASRLYAEEAQRAGGQTPAAPYEPAVPRETPPITGMETPTPEQMQAEFTPAELSQAQVDLFGEVIGTRNLTPEQIGQLDNHLNGGKAADIPQAPPETQGGLTNDVPPPATPEQKAAQVDAEWQTLTGETGTTAPPAADLVNGAPDAGADPATVPPVQDAAPTENQPVPQVPVAGQQEGPAPSAPAPLPFDRTERQFSPSELKVDAKRFQFKEGGDDAGVTDRLKGVKKWDPIKSGVTLVWEDLQGNHYIADGHQRHGLASRLEKEGQNPKIRAVVLREADGITAEEARAIAAAKNIAEGTGNAIDAAKILRSRPDMGVDLPPASALVRDAQGLAALSDDAFGMVVNKKVPAGYAAQVGRLAPDPNTHSQLLDLLAKEQPDNAIEAESMIRDALDAPAVQSTMEDMFGSAEVTQILFKERAQVLSAAATAIRKDRAAFATLVREEARLTGAGNKLATQSNAERAAQDAEILATLQAQARRKGPVADALAAAAKQLHDGTARQTVVRDFLNNLRRSGEATGPDGGLAGPAGRADQGIAARLEPDFAFSRRPAPAGPSLFDAPPQARPSRMPPEIEHEVKQLQERTVRFASGMSRLTDFEAGAHVFGGVDTRGIGLDINEISSAAFPAIAQRVLDWKARVFVDSGAFGLFRRNMRERERYQADVNDMFRAEGAAPPVLKDMDFKAVIADYEAIRDAIRTLNEVEDTYPAPVFVAPDVIGDQAASLRLLKEHAGDLRGFGENLIVPLQKGDKTLAQSYAEARQILGTDFIAGIPSNEKAITPAEFRDFVREAKPDRVHFLGAVAESKIEGRLQIMAEEGVKPSYLAADGNILRSALYGKPVEGTRSQQVSGVLKQDPAFQAEANYTPPPRSPGLFDTGADAKPQAVIPGAERISDKSLAERRAAAPLKGTRPQKNMDVGLFGSEADQQGFAFSAPASPLRPPSLADIANPVSGTPQQKLEQILKLTEENEPIVKDIIQEVDARLGTESKANRKDPEKILEKANRPSILEKKPWHDVEHLRDTYRFKTILEDVRQIPEVLAILKEKGIRLVKVDLDKVLNPQIWGFRIAAFDLRMPNGQIVEYYTPVREIEAAKDAGHLIFEDWRNRDLSNLSEEDALKFEAAIKESQALYQGAWDESLARTGATESDIRASLDSAKASFADTEENSLFMSSAVPGKPLDQVPSAERVARNPPPSTIARPSPDLNARSTIETSSGSTPGDGSPAAQGDIPSQGTAFARRPQQGTMPTNRPQAGTAVVPGAAGREGEEEIGLGQIPQLLDDTGALDGVPGYERGRGGDGNLSPQARPASAGSKDPVDPLTQPGGDWREAAIEVVVDGETTSIRAGDAVDFLVKRRAALKQLAECLNAT